MKRDMELIRKLLLEVEDSEGWAPDTFEIEGYSDEQIGYHCHLLVQSGLAEGSDTTTSGSSAPSAMLTTLTWEGHEFIEAARDEKRWKKAMGLAASKGGAVSTEILKALLVSLARQSLGI